MLQHNPRRAESFTVYGWAARQCHRLQEAKQFEQRAEQLAQARSRQRAEALLLKVGRIRDHFNWELMDGKQKWKIAYELVFLVQLRIFFYKFILSIILLTFL